MGGEKTRVCQVVETLETGGAEHIVADLVNGLGEGFEVSVCCVKHSGPASRRIHHPHIRVIELGKGDGNDYTVPLVLARLFHKWGVEVVHSHHWGVFCESVAGAVLGGVRKIIHTAHGEFPPASGGFWGQKKAWVRHGVERVFSRYTDAIVAVSHLVRDDIATRTGIGRDRIRVIHNGVSLRAKSSRGEGRLRQEFRISDSDFVVGFVGRLAPVKNVSLLIEAAGILHSEMPDLKVLIVGDGTERSRLHGQAESLGLADAVVFAGERDDASELLAISNVFVLPSNYEGISVALLEAMAEGLPVVASAVGGTPEIVEPDVTGILVPPGCPLAIVDAIRRLRGDPFMMRRLGEAGRLKVLSEFSVERMTQEYARLYTQSCLD